MRIVLDEFSNILYFSEYQCDNFNLGLCARNEPYLMEGENEHSEAKLFRQLIDEPNKALVAIYDRHGQRIIRYLRKFYPHDEETIKDITHETFIAVLENHLKLAELASPFHWMLRMAHNKAMDGMRARSKLPADPLDGLEELAAAETADSELERQELKAAIRRAVSSLTPREQEVFREIMMNNKTNKEVAEDDGVSVQTVKNLLVSGLKKLRGALKDMLGAILI